MMHALVVAHTVVVAHTSAMARAALTAVCAGQGVAQVAIDVNRTHATHPSWPGHARFHVVWQSLTVLLLCFLGVAVLWTTYLPPSTGFRLAALLASISPAAFLLTSALRGWFGGTFSDPGGIPPIRLRLGHLSASIDLNLLAVVVALVAIAGLLAMA